MPTTGKDGKRVVKQDGKTYRQNILGSWEAQKDWTGKDKVELDWTGKPKIKTDWTGKQKIETDWTGKPIVEPRQGADNGQGGIMGEFLFRLLMPIAFLALVFLFLWSLGVTGLIAGILLFASSLAAWFFARKMAPPRRKVLCAWYNAVVSALFVLAIVLSVQARGQLGFLAWLATGVCGGGLVIAQGILAGDSNSLYWLSLLSMGITWLFGMTLVYAMQHDRGLPGYIYFMIAAPIIAQFLVAVYQSIRLMLGPEKKAS